MVTILHQLEPDEKGEIISPIPQETMIRAIHFDGVKYFILHRVSRELETQSVVTHAMFEGNSKIT